LWPAVDGVAQSMMLDVRRGLVAGKAAESALQPASLAYLAGTSAT
jgi:hypothetical protein